MGIVDLNLFHINLIHPFHINIINRDHINWSVNTITKYKTIFKSLTAVAEKVEDIVVFESGH